MDLGLNWVDLVILGMLILFAVESFGRSLIFELVDFISFLLAFVLSFRYYNIPAKFFEVQFHIPHGLTLVLGFMSVWFISEVTFYLIVRLLLPKIPQIKFPFSRFLSIIPGLLRCLIFIAIILVIIATFPIQPVIKKSVLDSKVGSQILKYAYGLESPVKQVFGGVANDSFTFLTIKPKTDEKVNLGFQTDKISLDQTSENAMFELVNKERTGRGLKALVFDQKLQAVARGHSGDMFKKGYFS
ncbi:CvpA family protein, partial [Patescibacteria group bacterium]|nr:CvpA family protein [Patescibacteria group bacterium]